MPPTKSEMAAKNPTIRPETVRPSTAAVMLDVSYDFVLELVNRDVFTVIAPHGRGRGRDIFIPTDEIELYGRTRDEKAVRGLRDAKAEQLKIVAPELGESGA